MTQAKTEVPSECLLTDLKSSDLMDLVDLKDGSKRSFRDFSDSHVSESIRDRVKRTYFTMHTYQTVEFVKNRRTAWLRFDKFRAPIMSVLERLSDVLDESDPDVDVPNIHHAFQTAEGLRARHPNLPWLHLTGLIHDLGKSETDPPDPIPQLERIYTPLPSSVGLDELRRFFPPRQIMAVYGEPQWAVVGDTFPVGCAFAPSIVYREDSFHLNPDYNHPKYKTKYGTYSPNCGLDDVLMSWGHDEYMYQVLVHNKSTLPEEALYIIRYHSFYPWHDGGDYMHLCNEKDLRMLPFVREFQKFDLYTKSESIPDVDALRPYYQGLVDRYCPGDLEW
ncbi:unnamed protein product [Darwinula stevensoni]|uniref:Inositol oxygenase n=1 Tax=Darwinula stevensoni TaxID=69355 RepID=A0A7R8XG71_9CRUS|nr:unnamed protein product [Darwinula stevensoni]CAG0895983.1 unnamed protein product [Darwinula stevensoni]